MARKAQPAPKGEAQGGGQAKAQKPQGFRDLAEQFATFMAERADKLAEWTRTETLTAGDLIRLSQLTFRRDHRLQDPRVWPSIYLALVTAAQLGLEPDGPLKEGHITAWWDKRLGHNVAAFMPGYRGLIKLVRQSGAVKRIRSHVAYSGDEFWVEEGSTPRIHHRLQFDPERRGEPIAVYSIAYLADGEEDPEVAHWSEVEKARDQARKGQKGGGDTPAWAQWGDQMARKFVIKRHCNQLPMSPVARMAIDVDHAVSRADYASLEATLATSGVRQLGPGEPDGVIEAIAKEGPAAAAKPSGAERLKAKVRRRRAEREEPAARAADEPPPPEDDDVPDWGPEDIYRDDRSPFDEE